MATKLIKRLNPAECVLLVCDMQGKCRDTIKAFGEITTVIRRLIDTARILDMKIYASEHYPREESPTIPELNVAKYGIKVFEKTRFSMYTPELRKELSENVKSVILCGIEAHVCIHHTALELIEKGYIVHIVADGCSSLGAVISTCECVIMGLLEDSTHPKFEEIKNVILTPPPNTGLYEY